MIAMLRNLTPQQWFLVFLAALGVFGGATAQLTELFGAAHAHLIVTASSFLSTLISAIMVPLTGQGALINAVQAMPGVSKIVVNQDANQTLAAVAVDPNSKVEAAPGAEKAVEATAKAA